MPSETATALQDGTASVKSAARGRRGQKKSPGRSPAPRGLVKSPGRSPAPRLPETSEAPVDDLVRAAESHRPHAIVGSRVHRAEDAARDEADAGADGQVATPV